MSERDSEIDFDFFEEPEPEEEEPRSRSPLRRSPRGPERPPTNYTPLLRLVGLVVGFIVVVVLLVFVVDRCRGDSKQSTYQNYMGDVQKVATDSQTVGTQFQLLLAQPGIKVAKIEDDLNGLAQRQAQAVQQAEAINAPGALRTENQQMITALQLRESGLRGMSAAFAQTAKTTNPTEAATVLANQANRFVASDVIWDDLFKTPAIAQLRQEDVSGIEVPDSNFVQTPDLASTRSMVPIWQRINGTPTTGGATGAGLHGTNIVSVKVLPGGQTLSESTENTIVASTDLAFAVAVLDSGDNQEVKIEVTLTIQQSPTPVTKKQTIDLINPDETKTVVFRDFPSIDFGELRTMRIDVDPVPGEKNTQNNSAEYKVIFSVE